jgi:hypothetical protein
VNPWIILATCGPAAVASALMLAAICRAANQPPPYEPRRYPRTDA